MALIFGFLTIYLASMSPFCIRRLWRIIQRRNHAYTFAAHVFFLPPDRMVGASKTPSELCPVPQVPTGKILSLEQSGSVSCLVSRIDRGAVTKPIALRNPWVVYAIQPWF